MKLKPTPKRDALTDPDRTDTVTILWTEPGKLATKQFSKATPTSVAIAKAYDAGYLYTAFKPIVIRDISDLSEVLTFCERQPCALIIRGAPISADILGKKVTRTGSGEGESFVGNFRTPEVGRYYIEIDVDKFALPKDWKLTQATVKKVVEHVVHKLPEEFHNASYHWQLSSSAGVFDRTKVSAHLWFWLMLPIPEKDLKRWANHVNAQAGAILVDPALYQHVQPHYTAAPIFIGMPDPFPVRSGLIQKEKDRVNLVLPPIPTKAIQTKTPGVSATYESSGAGFDFFLNQIGDHAGGAGFHIPVRDAAASYVGTHGAEGTDPELLYSILRDRILAADASRHSEADIEQRASRGHIDQAISSAIQKFGNSASQRRKSRRIEGLAPHYPSADTKSVDIQQTMRSFLENYKW